jgi:hypothetical protein
MKPTNQSPSSQERDELERQVEALRREVSQLRLEQDLRLPSRWDGQTLTAALHFFIFY